VLHRLRNLWETAVADLRYQGWQVLAWRCLAKLVSPLVRLDGQILYDIDLAAPVRAIPARVDCVVDLARHEDLDAVVAMQFTPLPPETVAALPDREQLAHARLLRASAVMRQDYARRLRMGERCYVARVAGVIAHSNWMRLHGCGTEENCQVVLQPGEVYMTDGFTLEGLRGQGLHLAVHTEMLRSARRDGCHRAYTITKMTKAVSRRGLKKVGWRCRGTVLYLYPRGLRARLMFRLGADVDPLFLRSVEG
jgi:hypothetical protein